MATHLQNRVAISAERERERERERGGAGCLVLGKSWLYEWVQMSQILDKAISAQADL